MNMPLNNPMNPMQPPDGMPGLGMPYEPAGGVLGPGYEAMPMEPLNPIAGTPEGQLEIENAVKELQGIPDPAMEQIWEATLQRDAAGPLETGVPQDLLEVQSVGVEPLGAGLPGPNAAQQAGPPGEQLNVPNPYGALQEQFEFTDNATGAGPVTAITSHRETVIHAPGEGLIIRAPEPHADKLILDPDLRRQFTPQVPDSLLTPDELRAKYGKYFRKEELAMIREANERPPIEVPDRLLSDGFLRRKYGQDLTDQELARIREADRHAQRERILTILGRARDYLNRSGHP